MDNADIRVDSCPVISLKLFQSVYFCFICLPSIQRDITFSGSFISVLWPPASYAGRLPFCFTAVVYFILFSSPNLQGRLADRHQTLPHVRWWSRFIKFGRKFRWPLPPTFGGLKIWKYWRDFAQLRNLIGNISGVQQDVVNRKMVFQTTDTPAQTNLIWCTLVHKWRKIGPEFTPTQQVAIRLGIAMHLVYCSFFARVTELSSLLIAG